MYLIFCFYLLPALAITLKIRKRKLTNSLTSSSNTSVVQDNVSSLASFNNLFLQINNKLVTSEPLTTSTQNLSKKLQIFTFSYETIQMYKQRIIKNIQNILILQN